jgi:uncharacterized protein (DUF1810 family)
MTAASDPFDLERFVGAQDAVIEDALAELRSGRKTGHWIWFVFPQMAGLGSSPTSRFYAIDSLVEARAYLAHPVLGPRLLAAVDAVLSVRGGTAVDILGDVDARKLRSSATLFHRADPGEPRFPAVLERFFDGETDPATDRLLAQAAADREHGSER